MMKIVPFLFTLSLFLGCKMNESGKALAPLYNLEVNSKLVSEKRFYKLNDSEALCPFSTSGTFVFLPKGLQFSCTLSEKDIRYTLTQRDTTIYKDPCFEFFLDPNADGLDYYEFQFNAYPAVWDLKLKSSKGRINAPENLKDWDIGTSWEIKRIGTTNDSTDEDIQWSVYGIIPWENFKEGAPRVGDSWAYNFMRVDYDIENKPSYWAAFPTGKEMIHYPEKWPIVQF